MDASTYIAEQVPLLQSLHAQLALPPSALADDTARIDAAVRAAIISVVRSREDEVAEWEAQIADGKRALASLARAVGEQGRCVVYGGRRESEADEPLPQRHQRLVRQTEQLEQVYNERLAKVEQIIETIGKLSVLLGPPFEAPPPLQPVPGSAVPARSARSSLNRPAPAASENLAPTTNKRVSGRKSSAASLTIAEAKPESWMDVGEDVMTNLEAKVDAALAERDVRLRNLETTFNDLIWYRAELDLPPIAAPSFPDHLRPPRDEEETPGAHERYEGMLSHVMSLNEVPRSDDEGQEIQGMEDVEPEIGLMNWADEMLELWVAEKAARDARIQELFEKIEPLWIRLDVSQDFIDMFTEANRGSGLSTISAYEEELERVLEIRRTSLSSFVVGIRKEIAGLQDALLLSDNEKAEFGAFIDDEYTEELLSAHEAEAERLRGEVEAMGVHLVRVKEWIQLKADEVELEISAADPNRFKKRGTAMLREEKMRKRVEKLKPKIEGDLLAQLPAWEEEHGRPFLARGERVIDTIENAIAAKEAAKEAKKLAKLGLGPGPAASGRATPAPRGRSQPSTARGASQIKRDAPTPTPGMLSKRPRVGAGSSLGMRSSTSTVRTVSSSTAGTMRTVSSSSAASRNYNTPTAAAAQRRFGAPAAGRTNVPKQPDVFKSRPLPPIQPLKPQTLRPGLNAERAPQRRRESFKPRQSVAGGLLSARMDGLAELSGEDDDDVF